MEKSKNTIRFTHLRRVLVKEMILLVSDFKNSNQDETVIKIIYKLAELNTPRKPNLDDYTFIQLRIEDLKKEIVSDHNLDEESRQSKLNIIQKALDSCSKIVTRLQAQTNK